MLKHGYRRGGSGSWQQASEGSRNVARTCRHVGISRQAFYGWKRRHEAHGKELPHPRLDDQEFISS
jgi:transposase-like protein